MYIKEKLKIKLKSSLFISFISISLLIKVNETINDDKQNKA